ncbi:MAG TPA: hypothetical protein VF821_29080 [Lentzea sp.]
MSELLYVPEIDPPEQALHHAILYRDSISTLLPDDPERYLSDRTKRARDAGLFRMRLVRELWKDPDIAFGLGMAMYRRFAATKPYVGQPSDLQNAGQKSTAMADARQAVWAESLGILGRPEFDDNPAVRILLNEPNLFAALTAMSVAGRSRHDLTSPLVVLCYPNEIAELISACAGPANDDHLLARIDVGKFLPEVPPGVDTEAVIAFRQRYDDERRRLIRAVERLIKEAARTHGPGELADIERDVRKELDEALADMKQAGRRTFGGWVRRVAWFTVATGAGAIAGPAAAAAGSVAANWASNPVPRGGTGNDYAYLYRVQDGTDGFISLST